MPCFAACQRPAQDDFCAGGRDLGGAGTAVATDWSRGRLDGELRSSSRTPGVMF